MRERRKPVDRNLIQIPTCHPRSGSDACAGNTDHEVSRASNDTGLPSHDDFASCSPGGRTSSTILPVISHASPSESLSIFDPRFDWVANPRLLEQRSPIATRPLAETWAHPESLSQGSPAGPSQPAASLTPRTTDLLGTPHGAVNIDDDGSLRGGAEDKDWSLANKEARLVKHFFTVLVSWVSCIAVAWIRKVG
jgi:hypothetical protein